MSSHKYAKVEVDQEDNDAEELNDVLGSTTIEMSGLSSKEQLEESNELNEENESLHVSE